MKKGEKSVGVARQYTGTADDTVNCQVGVFLAYSSEKGAAFLDWTLYLPRAWTDDPLRRAEAGVSKELIFRNKIELAEEMLERTIKADVPTRWGCSRTPSTGGPMPSGCGWKGRAGPTR